MGPIFFQGKIKQCKSMVSLREFPPVLVHCLGWESMGNPGFRGK